MARQTRRSNFFLLKESSKLQEKVIKTLFEVTNWVALDDMELDFGWDEDFMKDHFVRTNPKIGLSKENASQALKYLTINKLFVTV